MNAKDTLVMILIVAVLCVASFLAGCLRKSCASHTNEIVMRDTILRIDTIRLIPEPITKVVIVVDSIPVPFPVYKTDTLIKIDTLYLPREQKHYQDQKYEAWVSGYQPSLDSIWIYEKTTEVNTISVPSRKRWGIGITAGYGVTICAQPVFAPYVGVGINYNIISW